MGSQANAQIRVIWNTLTIKNDRDFLTTIYNILKDFSSKISSVSSGVLGATIQPINNKTVAESQKHGPNVLGLDASKGPLILFLATASWVNESDEGLMTKVARQMNEAIANAARERGLLDKFVYANYASLWQDPLTGYGPEAKQALQAASRKYDPNGVFQDQVEGGFKLFQ